MYFCKDLLFYYARVIASVSTTILPAIVQSKTNAYPHERNAYILSRTDIHFTMTQLCQHQNSKKPKQNVVIDRTDSILLRRTRVALMLHVASTYENY